MDNLSTTSTTSLLTKIEKYSNETIKRSNNYFKIDNAIDNNTIKVNQNSEKVSKLIGGINIKIQNSSMHYPKKNATNVVESSQ